MSNFTIFPFTLSLIQIILYCIFIQAAVVIFHFRIAINRFVATYKTLITKQFFHNWTKLDIYHAYEYIAYRKYTSIFALFALKYPCCEHNNANLYVYIQWNECTRLVNLNVNNGYWQWKLLLEQVKSSVRIKPSKLRVFSLNNR